MSTPSCVRIWPQYACCTNLAGALLTFPNFNRETDKHNLNVQSCTCVGIPRTRQPNTDLKFTLAAETRPSHYRNIYVMPLAEPAYQ